jgi:hypothetical protein
MSRSRKPSGTDGSQTLRWRGTDSNCQFRDASQPPTAWAPSSGGGRSLFETPQQLYRFDEVDDRSDDTAGPTIDRRPLGRSLETAPYLARNWKFESIPLPAESLRTSVPVATSKSWPALILAGALRLPRATSEEVVQAHIDRMHAANPAINAMGRRPMH